MNAASPFFRAPEQRDEPTSPGIQKTTTYIHAGPWSTELRHIRALSTHYQA